MRPEHGVLRARQPRRPVRSPGRYGQSQDADSTLANMLHAGLLVGDGQQRAQRRSAPERAVQYLIRRAAPPQLALAHPVPSNLRRTNSLSGSQPGHGCPALLRYVRRVRRAAQVPSL